MHVMLKQSQSQKLMKLLLAIDQEKKDVISSYLEEKCAHNSRAASIFQPVSSLSAVTSMGLDKMMQFTSATGQQLMISPLLLAILRQNNDIVNLLLHYGASPTVLTAAHLSYANNKYGMPPQLKTHDALYHAIMFLDGTQNAVYKSVLSVYFNSIFAALNDGQGVPINNRLQHLQLIVNYHPHLKKPENKAALDKLKAQLTYLKLFEKFGKAPIFSPAIEVDFNNMIGGDFSNSIELFDLVVMEIKYLSQYSSENQPPIDKMGMESLTVAERFNFFKCFQGALVGHIIANDSVKIDDLAKIQHTFSLMVFEEPNYPNRESVIALFNFLNIEPSTALLNLRGTANSPK